MDKIHIFKSVLLGTLIVVFICGCGKDTSQYIKTDEIVATEVPMDTEEIASDVIVEKSEEELLLYIYVCGEVSVPGVYTLPEGSRVCDLFEAAGGFTEEAATDYWNQARLLVDGEMIYVPTKEEANERIQGGEAVLEKSTQGDNHLDGKVNINTASKTILMEIPGIGEKKADAIIEYREANGSFSSIEDVKKVEGIKDGVYEKMKEYIVIN